MATNVTKEQIERARSITALDYFQRYEPDGLTKHSTSEWRLKSNRSVSVSTDASKGWYDHATGEGGHSALDFMIKSRGMGFVDAVTALAGAPIIQAPEAAAPKREQEAPREFTLPEQHVQNGKTYNNHVSAYLHVSRGIDYEVINHHIKRGALYEEGGRYHNAVFVGFDKDGTARYAGLHSTNSEARFVGEVGGSDKRYSFSEHSKMSDMLMVFEGSIDAMSAQTLMKYNNKVWRDVSVLSLGGVAVPEGGQLPVTLERFLGEHPDIKRVVLSLDNDEAGRYGTSKLTALLTERGYSVTDRPPKSGKDINDELMEFGKQNPKIVSSFQPGAKRQKPANDRGR